MSRLWPLVLLVAAVAAQPAAEDLSGAQWIWREVDAGGNPLDFPVEVVRLRGRLAVSEVSPIASAELQITCDNLYSFTINGRYGGESDGNPDHWRLPRRFDVKDLLHAGHNTIAIEAGNTLAGPAGLLAKLVVTLVDGTRAVLVSDETWRATRADEPNWTQPDYNDQGWPLAMVVAPFGQGPWGAIAAPDTAEPAGQQASGPEAEAPADYAWPEAIAFIGDDCSLSLRQAGRGGAWTSLTITIFNPRDSRAFPEHDLPAPMKVGRRIYRLGPARPDSEPEVLFDAGEGAVGSLAATLDGTALLFSYVPAGESFFHVYRLPLRRGRAAGPPEQLTFGTHHDIDPAELPDGRIVFTSTRTGLFEEYHSPPARGLFTIGPDGGEPQLLTPTFIFDNEPEVLADGRIIFVRTDNFFDRGKVEVLLHAVHPDGSRGQTEFGLELGPSYGGRLRAYAAGSPAPLDDGRVAFVTSGGLAIGTPGQPGRLLRHLPFDAGDVAATPDGRLLVSLPQRLTVGSIAAGGGADAGRFQRLALIDPDAAEPAPLTVLANWPTGLHSPVVLAARRRPVALPSVLPADRLGQPGQTGLLVCQDVRRTLNTGAGWDHIKAIRVLAGAGQTLRSSHSYIVHAGSTVTELGTVPIAPDGSFAVEVPADTAIAFQAVDAEGRSELNEMSWIYVRAGERRSCVGCHQPRSDAPPRGLPLSATVPAMRLVPETEPFQFRGNNAAVTGLMELQFDRYREVAGFNRHDGGPTVTGAAEIAVQARLAAEGPEDRRLGALTRLAVARDPAGAPAAAIALGAERREVRLAAAVALAACGTRESLPPLLDALVDRDPIVAQAAAMALENLSGWRAPFDPFAPRAARREQAAAWRAALAPEAWPQRQAELLARLASDDRDVVRRAAVALGHCGDATVADDLAAAFRRLTAENPAPAWRAAGHRGDNAQFAAADPVNPRAAQEVIRAWGRLAGPEAVPELLAALQAAASVDTGNLFWAEALAEALGRISGPEAEAALVEGFAGLAEHWRLSYWYGDHDALMACHASPPHALLLAALDHRGSTAAAPLAPAILRSLPTDPDRLLAYATDDYERLAGRVLRRAGLLDDLVETCLALLGDPAARSVPELAEAISVRHGAWAGSPGAEIRAAQTLSALGPPAAYLPRIIARYEHWSTQPMTLPRVFDRGIPVIEELPLRHWVSFYLARTLGQDGSRAAVDALLAGLASPPEAADGRPDPLGVGVLFLHNDLTPCWRAETAWALGRLGDRRAIAPLLAILADDANAVDTRYAAAQALVALSSAAERAALPALLPANTEHSISQLVRGAAAAAAAD